MPVWTSSPEPVERPSRVSARRVRQFTVAAVVVALAGINLGVASWYQPFRPPHFVPLWVTEYRNPFIADRSGAAADRDAIRSANLFPDAADTYSTQSTTLVLGELQQLGQPTDSDSLVVYLSGYAVPGADGDVNVLTANVDPPADDRAVSVRRVLQLMALAPHRHKLLVLDVTPPPVDPVMGFLRQDAPAELADLVASVQAEQPSTDDSAAGGLFVLLPCQSGQTARASRILGRTVFGYYLQEGLSGAAIPYSPDGRWHSRRVSVRALARFLRARVDRWTRQNLGVRQTPVLVGGGSDFDSDRDDAGRSRSPRAGHERARPEPEP